MKAEMKDQARHPGWIGRLSLMNAHIEGVIEGVSSSMLHVGEKGQMFLK